MAMDGDVAACSLIFDRLEPVAHWAKGVDLRPKRPARTINTGNDRGRGRETVSGCAQRPRELE
jgi:hypothetical protein